MVCPELSSKLLHTGHWKSSYSSSTGCVTPGSASTIDPSACLAAGSPACACPLPVDVVDPPPDPPPSRNATIDTPATSTTTNAANALSVITNPRRLFPG